MKRLSAALVLAAMVTAGAPRAAAQSTAPPASAAAAAPISVAITADALADLPRRIVSVEEEPGRPATYSGVDLGALLAKNGAPHGKALHGRAAADYAVVRASDGYRALFAMAELDPSISAKVVLLADRRNGMPLDAKLGPFRVIVPDEKHHLRWIRNVIAVDVAAPP